MRRLFTTLLVAVVVSALSQATAQVNLRFSASPFADGPRTGPVSGDATGRLVPLLVTVGPVQPDWGAEPFRVVSADDPSRWSAPSFGAGAGYPWSGSLFASAGDEDAAADMAGYPWDDAAPGPAPAQAVPVEEAPADMAGYPWDDAATRPDPARAPAAAAPVDEAAGYPWDDAALNAAPTSVAPTATHLSQLGGCGAGDDPMAGYPWDDASPCTVGAP